MLGSDSVHRLNCGGLDELAETDCRVIDGQPPRYQNLETRRRQQRLRPLAQGAILKYSPGQTDTRDSGVTAHCERLFAHGVSETRVKHGGAGGRLDLCVEQGWQQRSPVAAPDTAGVA